MDAKNLMIGDWIQIKGNNCKISYITPFDIGDTRLAIICNDYDGNQYLDGFKSIHLTENILKANGFWTNNGNWHCKRVRENGVFDVCVNLDYKEIEITKICGDGTDEEEADYGMNIELGDKELFVHELQHILRFYDINDLADNFKIE